MTLQPLISKDLATKPFWIGIDVGGTSIKIGLVDDQGRTLAFDAIDTQEPDGPEAAMQRAANSARAMLAKSGIDPRDIARVGLGTPGSQDIPRGMLIEPPNHPHWHHFPIVRCLEDNIGYRVSYANDANAAAFGEFWVGTGRVHHSMILLTLGTGVGGGIIIGDSLVVGKNSFGGECGHIVIDPSPTARLCAWGGGRGHLEAYASATAVALRAREQLAAGAVSSLASDAETVTAKRIYEAAETGDAWSMRIIEETADYLAVGITTMVHMIDPGLVVLGGAMNFGGATSPIGRRFLERIRSSFANRSFDYVARGTTIDFASLGSDAGYLGAAGIARMEHQHAT